MFDSSVDSYVNGFDTGGDYNPYGTGPSYDGGGGGGFGSGFPDISISLPSGGSGGPTGASGGPSLVDMTNAAETSLKVSLGQWQTGARSADDALAAAWAVLNGYVQAATARFGAEGQQAAAQRDRRISPAMLRWDWIAYYIDPITGGHTTLAPLPTGTPTGPGSPATAGATFGGIAVLYLALAALIVIWAVKR